MESFDTETSYANIKARYETSSASGSATTGSGRTGNCLPLPAGTGLGKTVAQGPTFFIGVALKMVGDGASPQGNIIELWDGGTKQVYFYLNPGLTITAFRGNGASLGTTSGAVSLGSWDYFEFKVTIDPAAGIVQVLKNGVVDLNLTGINTRNTANSYASQVRFAYNGDSGFGRQLQADDIYICDAGGAAPWNTYLSGIDPNRLPRVGTKAINGAGALTQWTPDSGSNYARVNEANEDGDTSYVSDTNAGDIDLYTLAGSGLTTNTILGVQATDWLKLDAAGSRGHCIEWRSGGANYDGATNTITNTAGYQPVTEIKPLDPATSAQWTRANLDALQIGHKVVS
jgi:hypothetical protein